MLRAGGVLSGKKNKGGRPRKFTAPVYRTTVIEKEEDEAIQKAAYHAGGSISEWMRQTLMKALGGKGKQDE